MGKKILIATGTSVNKRTRAVSTLSDYLKAHGLDGVAVVAENVYGMDLAAIKPDVIVLIGPKTFKTDIPVVDGTAFITQIASMVSQTCEKVAALVRS